MHNFLTSLKSAILFAFLPFFWLASEVSAQIEPDDDTLIEVNYQNMPMSQIALQYGILTDQNVIQDGAIQTATLSIQTTKPLPRAAAAEFIEKSLLLNGYALIPAGAGTVKIIAVPESTGAPGSEGVPIYSDVDDLPTTDQVVAFVLKFDHLGSEEAATKLAEIFPSHGYGTIVPFPQASSVVITDSTAIIRKYVQLQDHIDVAPMGLPIDIREFPLDRGDAIEVAEAISELLELDSGASGAGSEGGARQPTTPATATTPGGGTSTVLTSYSPDIQTVDPKIRAISRTNTLVAIGQPDDLDYIERLVTFFDAPASRKKFLKRRLEFLPVSTFLPIAQHALMPGVEVEGSGDIAGGEEGANDQSSNAGSSLGGGSSGGGSSGFGSSGGGGSSLSSAEFTSDVGPQSIVVGKTLLIADNVHNTLIASGPEEHLATLEELIDGMDIRPRQIQISAVIAQLTLGDDLNYGADLFKVTEQGQFNNQLAGVLRNRTGATPDISTLTDVASLLPAAQGLTVYGQVGDAVSAYVDALHTKNQFRILARPTLYALNNRWSSISTGQRIAVPSSTLSTLDPNNVNQAAVSSSISYEEVVLEVKVLPLINSRNEVTLLIEQVNDDIIGSQNISGNDIPTIGTQKMHTTVVVPNGGTILLGGLISEDNRKTDSGLPILVGLPVIGPIFGSNREKDRQELLIFIQPRIIEDDVDLVNAQKDFDMRSEFAEEVREFAAPKVISEAKPKKLLQRLFQRRQKSQQLPDDPLDQIYLKPEIEN
ncbi:MAG: general secretion pathway protein D [Verrucomicrobiales bacterium]|jgi:general secretion pathway protein D